MSAFVAGFRAAGANPTRASFMKAMSGMTNFDANGLLAPEKVNFRDYAPARVCMWAARLEGVSFSVVPGTPICAPNVKFAG
jgi:branched-chain amino acid transport system substrate-binding protein